MKEYVILAFLLATTAGSIAFAIIEHIKLVKSQRAINFCKMALEMADMALKAKTEESE